MEAKTETPAIIKSPRQRDGMIVGKISMCANNETNHICDQMLKDGLKCKMVSKVSIGDEGQEWHGKNISLCCSKNQTPTECYQSSSMLKKNREDEWEIMMPHNTTNCLSSNGYCININVENIAVIRSFGGQPDFEVIGKWTTCSKMHGSYIVNCDKIGTGCKTVNQLQLGEGGQMIEGETEICCCKGKLCNA